MNKFMEARDKLVKFIQDGNGIREEATALLQNIQGFQPKLFGYKNLVNKSDDKFSELYRKFLNFDKETGLFSETLAMALAVDQNGKFVRLPTLDEYTLLSIYASHLSAHRETLRNLLRDAENRINSHREALNNRTIRFIAFISLIVAVISILLTLGKK
ncbi:MAG: hypothetical protein HY435_00720 [Candidatus Liptonbacteria bacterium]|nr:hypothetical protein [Candidatus Liptonbacteria bacterium]